MAILEMMMPAYASSVPPSAITRTQNVSANATSVAISSTSNGDVIVVWAYSISTTIPSLPGGFTNLVGTAGTQQAARLGYKVSSGGDTSSGTWTNAANVVCLVYSGVNTSTPFGATPTIGAGSSTAVIYSGINPNTVGSMILGFSGAKSATSGMASSPTVSGTDNLTRQTNQTTVQGCDLTVTTAAYNGQTLTISPTSRWQSVTIEIKD